MSYNVINKTQLFKRKSMEGAGEDTHILSE